MGNALLERERELAVLAEAVRDAVRGHGSVVLVQGQAGIGKSSVVTALQGHLDDGVRLLLGPRDASWFA